MNTGKNNPVILSYIIKNGLKLDFNEIPFQLCCNNFLLSKEEIKITKSEIQKLKSKKVIVNTDKRTGDYISGVFTRSKKDGSHRMILNLKNFNKFVCYGHFKMESIQKLLNVIKKDTFMASIDLKDAFYSVPVVEHHQKYLKFFTNGYLKFTCIPNGYGPAMRIFTKIMKVPFSILRVQGHTSVVYVDSSYLQGDSYKSCFNNVNDTKIMLRSLGFTIHPEKSVLKPTQNLIYIGFIINSTDMTLKSTEEKKQNIYDLCTKLFEKSKPTIQYAAQVIGSIVASFPAVPLGPLVYRALEIDKIVGLKWCRQNYDAETELSNETCSELVWWKHNIKNSFQYLVIAKPDITIFTDASKIDWGITDGHNPSGGQWAEHERMYINVLELKAAFIGIHIYCHNRSYRHIRFMSDSSTAIAYHYNKGGIKSKRSNEIAKEIWLWCFKSNSFTSAAHIPGKHNNEADRFSRKVNNNREWQLNRTIFIEITNTFGYPKLIFLLPQ